jgi:hypothetical protein
VNKVRRAKLFPRPSDDLVAAEWPGAQHVLSLDEGGQVQIRSNNLRGGLRCLLSLRFNPDLDRLLRAVATGRPGVEPDIDRNVSFHERHLTQFEAPERVMGKASRRLLAASKNHGEGAAPASTAKDLVVHVNDEPGGVRNAHVSPSNDRVQRIRLAAYRRAEARGFTPGAELEDWLAAEQEVDSEIG